MAPKPRTFNIYDEYDMTYYDISVLLDKSTAAVRMAINDQYGGSAVEYLASLGLRDAESVRALIERNEAKAQAEAERERARAERIQEERAQEREQEAQKTRDAVEAITEVLVGAAANRSEKVCECDENTLKCDEIEANSQYQPNNARTALSKLNSLIDIMCDADIEEMMNEHGVLDVYAIRSQLKDLRFSEFGEYVNWDEVVCWVK